MAAAKCSFWDALFTLGIACVKAKELKAKLMKTQEMFKRELAVAADLNSKMHYFEGIKTLSNLLVEESTGLLDTTKEFR